MTLGHRVAILQVWVSLSAKGNSMPIERPETSSPRNSREPGRAKTSSALMDLLFAD